MGIFEIMLVAVYSLTVLLWVVAIGMHMNDTADEYSYEDYSKAWILVPFVAFWPLTVLMFVIEDLLEKRRWR